MQTPFQIQFHLIQRQMLKNFEKELNKSDVIEIVNIPSVDKALEMISSIWFKSEFIAMDNLIGVIMKIEEKFNNNLNENFRKLKFNKKTLIMFIFESTLGKYRSDIFWKNAGSERVYKLDDFEDSDGSLAEYCRRFIMKELKLEKSAVHKIFHTKEKIKIQELGNESGCNLLMIAVQENNCKMVQKLLEYGFHVDCEDTNGRNAAEFAWINFTDETSDNEGRSKANKIIMSLLRLNSRFPAKKVGFEYKKASPEVQEFINMCEGLHKLLGENRLKELKERIDNEPHLCHFYDRNNQGIMFDRDETGEIKALHEDTSPLYEEIVTDVNLSESPTAHLFILKSKTKVNFNPQQSQKQWMCVEDAFKILDEIPECSLILKVAATWKKLKIFCDFKQDIGFYKDQINSLVTKANMLSNGTIYIGAKKLMDNVKKFEVIGVMIKELSRLACMITFMNHTNPYSCSNFSSSKKSYMEKVITECEKNKEYEKLISNALSEPKELIHSELIACVVQIMMKYRICDEVTDQENAKKLRKMQDSERKFKELFKYHKNTFEPRMEETLNVLKMLHDTSRVIHFESLTKSMKERVSHGKLILQGAETTFYNLLGNDGMILRLLTSSEIRDCLIKNQTIKISDKNPTDSKCEIIRRKFVDFNVEMDEKVQDEDMGVNKNVKNYMQIKSETESEKFFLLADHDKKIRTATFEDLAVKLKDSYKSFWVSYIKVKDHKEILEEHVRKTLKLTITNITELLQKILNLSSEMEVKIFTKLFNNNKVILLLDTIDDVSPKIYEFFIKMLILLKKERTHQLWISIQPQNIKRLEDIFEVKAYKTVITIYRKEKRTFIEKTLKSLNYCNSSQRFTIAQEILSLIDRIEEDLCHLCTIENPQIIENITALYIRSKININTSLCEIFEQVVDRIRRKTEKNYKSDEKNPLAGVQLLKFHQAFALKSAFGNHYDEKFGFKLEDLSIEMNWEKEKHNYTTERITRYKFLMQDPDQRDSFDFAHESYNQFYMAQFIISNLFNQDLTIVPDEFPKIFKILSVMEIESKKFQISRLFLLNFMRNEVKSDKQKLHPKAEALVIKEALGILKEKESKLSLRSLELWSIFLIKNSMFLKILWQVDELSNMIKRFLTTDLLSDYNDFKKFIELVEYCFGSNWHVMFNKSKQTLVCDDEVANFNDKFDKNFLKLLSLVEENMKIEDERLVYNKLIELKVFKYVDVKILNKVFKRIFDIFKSNKQGLIDKTIKFVEFYASKTSNEEGLMYFGSVFQELLDYDKDIIREVLFYNYRSDLHPLVHAIRSTDVNLFRMYKNLYITYKDSWTELEDIIILYSVIFKYISFIHDPVYPEFEMFVKEIFSDNKNRLKEFIQDYFGVAKKILVRKNILKSLMKLISYVFSEDEMENLEMSTKFTTFSDFIM
ncbi:hypothetical protein ACKWTF_015459 [Chironomus riparius]